MSHRTQQVLTWSGVISLIGLLIAVTTAAVKAGQAAAAIDAKLDRTVYQQGQTELERRLGDITGDLRVIRAFVCRRDPGACRQ